jgi:hypothetical protein
MLKIPKEMRRRLADAGAKNGFKTPDDFALHLVDKGLQALGVPAEGRTLALRLEQLVEDRGYSTDHEAVEHLLERGLSAYEAPNEDEETLKARLRGLGYIE